MDPKPNRMKYQWLEICWFGLGQLFSQSCFLLVSFLNKPRTSFLFPSQFLSLLFPLALLNWKHLPSKPQHEKHSRLRLDSLLPRHFDFEIELPSLFLSQRNHGDFSCWKLLGIGSATELTSKSMKSSMAFFCFQYWDGLSKQNEGVH